MRALLDVNVIMALLDYKHVFHTRAHDWWAINIKNGWASCPLTENGVVRIMSNPNYDRPHQFSVSDLIGRLRGFTDETNHEFWADSISFLDDTLINSELIHGPKQIADLYLLALATEHHGRLVTFDQGIPISAVVRAIGNNLCLI